MKLKHLIKLNHLNILLWCVFAAFFIGITVFLLTFTTFSRYKQPSSPVTKLKLSDESMEILKNTYWVEENNYKEIITTSALSATDKQELLESLGNTNPQNHIILATPDIEGGSLTINRGDMVSWKNLHVQAVKVIGLSGWRSIRPIQPDNSFTQAFDYKNTEKYFVIGSDGNILYTGTIEID